MSRTWIVVTILVVAALGFGAALTLGLFDGNREEAVATTAQQTVALTTIETVTTLGRTPPMTAMDQDEDPLCAAHANLTAALDGHLPVQGPDDLETVSTATVAFYTEAVEYVEEPERTSFDAALAYQKALFDWSEANAWDPQRSIEDVVDNPPPTVPGDAFQIVRQVIEDRCGVTITVE